MKKMMKNIFFIIFLLFNTLKAEHKDFWRGLALGSALTATVGFIGYKIWSSISFKQLEHKRPQQRVEEYLNTREELKKTRQENIRLRETLHADVKKEVGKIKQELVQDIAEALQEEKPAELVDSLLCIMHKRLGHSGSIIFRPNSYFYAVLKEQKSNKRLQFTNLDHNQGLKVVLDLSVK